VYKEEEENEKQRERGIDILKSSACSLAGQVLSELQGRLRACDEL
jgi:hypothetical protein